jgi:hypothetical protein
MRYLAEYRNLLAYMDPVVDAHCSTQNPRAPVAGSLFDIAAEHAKSISILLENKHDASAYALLRCLFEALVRGAWLLHCATDTEYQRFIHKDRIERDSGVEPHFGDMLQEVEEAREWGDYLSRAKKTTWESLNSYTHGGMHLAIDRFDGETIQASRDTDRAESVVIFSALLAYVAFSQILELAENDDLEKYVLEAGELMRGWAFME